MIIWNNDGDDLRVAAFGSKEIWSPKGMLPLPQPYDSPESFLGVRLAGIAETPVTIISYCGVFTWPVWDYPERHLKALGKNPLQWVIDFAHRNGKQFYFNLRMNDAHTSGPHWNGAAYWEPFRLNHPEFLQARIGKKNWEKIYLPWAQAASNEYPLQDVLERNGPACRDLLSWATYDYSHPEVREYFHSLVATACERYEIDGIDLDWLRAPYFFRAGEDRRHVPAMNDFVKKVAHTVRRYSQQKGRDIKICMRVPDSPRRALELGLDVEFWASQGWVDVLVAGNGLAVFGMPFASWMHIGKTHGIPVIACISRSAPHLHEPPLFLGACHRAWKSGVDGLYFFNHFVPEEYHTLSSGASPETLLSMKKGYALDHQSSAFENGTVFEGPLPMTFEIGEAESLTCLEIEIPEEMKRGTSGTLQVTWDDGSLGQRGQWMFNSKSLAAGKVNHHRIEYQVTNILSGRNTLKLAFHDVRPGKKSRLELLSLSLLLD